MRIVGIDIGSTLGFALLTGKRDGLVFAIPSVDKYVDEQGLVHALREHTPEAIYFEKVHAFPGQGIVATATLMCAFGQVRGVCAGLGIPYITVMPKTWKKEVLKGFDLGTSADAPAIRKKKNKEAAVAFAGRRYPQIGLIPARCRVPDHNLADALCIAYYGRLMEQKDS